MDIRPDQINDMWNNVRSGSSPTMFYAICTTCNGLRLFDAGNCVECNATWPPIVNNGLNKVA